MSQFQEQERIATAAGVDIDNLQLTLAERGDTIAELEDTIKEKDTEIGLQRIEIDSLTLIIEKLNQQQRTEADIQSAKSAMLQGKSPERTLENLANATNKKDNG